MNKLVILRHGESVWNKENRSTGWTDVERRYGAPQVEQAMQALAAQGKAKN